MKEDDLKSFKYDDFKKFVHMEDGDKALVIKVYDGDTLTVGWRHGKSLVRESVRIRGIDTPELRSKCMEEKNLAWLAKSRLEDVTLRQYVTLVAPETDKYGRILCDLRTETIPSISEYMLQTGAICREYGGGKRLPWAT